MSVIATLALINGLAIANTQNGSEFKNYNGYSVYDLKAETITTASYNTYKFSQIAQYKQVDFIVSASSGTITTANVDWCLEDGTIIASETLTSGTGLSNFKAPLLILKIYNQVAAPVTITGAIMFTDNPLRTITVAGTVAVNTRRILKSARRRQADDRRSQFGSSGHICQSSSPKTRSMGRDRAPFSAVG